MCHRTKRNLLFLIFLENYIKISYNNFFLITEVANKTREYFVLKRCSSSDIFGFYSREVDIICMRNGTGKTYS